MKTQSLLTFPISSITLETSVIFLISQLFFQTEPFVVLKEPLILLIDATGLFFPKKR